MLRCCVLFAGICCLLNIAGCAGQNAATEVASDATSVSPTGDSGQTGPSDPAQLVAPGPVDENLAAEFTETASGLRYRILRASDKRKPTAANEVVVHYKGWLDNGQIFDSSYRHGETISFLLQGVIPGWTEGLQLVGEGGMIELEIPSYLGYGNQGNGEIPPGARLHFLVELMAIR
jgi:FKBP-type peptidyl-prolyl cis-trans isomerase FkpA